MCRYRVLVMRAASHEGCADLPSLPIKQSPCSGKVSRGFAASREEEGGKQLCDGGLDGTEGTRAGLRLPAFVLAR